MSAREFRSTCCRLATEPVSPGAHSVRIISGGQTGVDRAALDAAIEAGIPCGGFCPRGRLAEDGVIPERYPVEELASPDYDERTRRNVELADATLVITRGEPTGGTCYTIEYARRLGQPLLVCRLDLAGEPTRTVAEWLHHQQPAVVNVAGPRESVVPGIHREALGLLRRVLASGPKVDGLPSSGSRP